MAFENREDNIRCGYLYTYSTNVFLTLKGYLRSILSLSYRPAHIVYQENIKTFPLQKVANPELG